MGDLYQLPSTTYAASGRDNVPLRDLPVQRRGRIPHVTRFIFEVDYTPTTTALPTTAGNNMWVTAMDFWDGRVNRFVGGFNHMRAHERVNTGAIRIPDSDTDIASASARFFRRVLHVGPPQCAGGLGDFAIPTGALLSGELRLTMGALTDFAADCTAATGTCRTFADLEMLDEVRIPPAYQVQAYSANSSDFLIPGRALFCSLYAFDSGAFGAWTAGDLANIRLDLGLGEIVSTVPAAVLNVQMMDDFARGDIGSFMGEPRAAGDDNHKTVNRASPTALTGGASDLQAVLWMRPGKKLSKCEVAESNARIQWSGTQTSAVFMAARILPQSPSVVAAIATAALKAIGRPQKDIRIKTLSKKPYSGPYMEFMPYAVKV